MREIYYKSSHITVWFEQDRSLGGATWRGNIPSPELREGFIACTQLIGKKHLKYWLADNSKMGLMSQEDHEWMSLMAPTVLNSGLIKMATLVSENIFQHMSVVELFDSVSGELTFQNHFFQTEADAMNWLQADVSANKNAKSSPYRT